MIRFYKYTFHLGLVVITLVMLGVGWYAACIPEQQEQQGNWVAHTHEVLNQLDMLTRHIAESETGQRGYLLTGDSVYLAPYTVAIERIDKDIENIRALTFDNPLQQARLPSLQTQIKGKLAEFKETIRLRDLLNVEGALKIVLSGRGREQMEAIHQQIEAMRAEEENLLQLRSSQWHRAAQRTRVIFLLCGVLIYALICIVYAVLYKELERRKHMADSERNMAAMQRKEAEKLAQIVVIQREIAAHHLEMETAMRIITGHMQSLTQAEGSIVEMLEGKEMVYRSASGSGSSCWSSA